MRRSTISGSLQIKGKAPSFLIVALRYIGDVLVTTPLALSIKRALPEARVEYLVFEGTEAVLAKNPCVDRVHTIPRGAKDPRHLLRLAKKFDWALGCGGSDRTVIAAAVCGRRAAAFDWGRWWERLLLDYRCPYDDSRHAVRQMLALLEPLGIAPVPAVTMGFDDADRAFVRERLPPGSYVVLHPYSRGRYKYWPARRWGELAALILRETGCRPLFTVTGAPEDAAFLEEILALAPKGCRRLEKVSLSRLAAAIEGAAAYVGIDTVVSHLAAAVGTEVVAILGPTRTCFWAPWPNGSPQLSPFAANRGVQRSGNVAVVQKSWDCVPCNKVTCSRSGGERIDCLEELEAHEVFQVLCESLALHGAETDIALREGR